MKIRTILIDDEVFNIEILNDLIKKFCTSIEVIDTASSVPEAVAKIIDQKPDLIFLDIEIHDKTGFDLLRAIESINLQVIICSAYEKYALEGYRHNILGYLLKPINELDLINYVQRVEKNIQKKLTSNIVKEHAQTNYGHDFITIAHKENIDLIELDKICYLESSGNYTIVHTVDQQKIMSSKPLGYYEAQLQDKFFIRIHNSFIINKKCSVRYIKSKYGAIELIHETTIPISSTYKKNVSEWLGIH